MKNKFNILLAEDNPIDTKLFHLALERNEPRNVEIREVVDGMEVLDYLQGKGRFADRFHFPFPNLLILDLKMPQMDGLQVLAWLRKHPKFSHLNTIVLSGSGLQEDVTEAYHLCVNSYFKKPTDFDQFTRLLGLIMDYWIFAEQASPEDPSTLSGGRVLPHKKLKYTH